MNLENDPNFKARVRIGFFCAVMNIIMFVVFLHLIIKAVLE